MESPLSYVVTPLFCNGVPQVGRIFRRDDTTLGGWTMGLRYNDRIVDLREGR
jgi:hypothetical protein